MIICVILQSFLSDFVIFVILICDFVIFACDHFATSWKVYEEKIGDLHRSL